MSSKHLLLLLYLPINSIMHLKHSCGKYFMYGDEHELFSKPRDVNLKGSYC